MRHSPSPTCAARGAACSLMQANAGPAVAPQGAGRRLPPGDHVPASLVMRLVSPSPGPGLYFRREPSWAQTTRPRARHAVRRWNRGHDQAGSAALPCPRPSAGAFSPQHRGCRDRVRISSCPPRMIGRPRPRRWSAGSGGTRKGGPPGGCGVALAYPGHARGAPPACRRAVPAWGEGGHFLGGPAACAQPCRRPQPCPGLTCRRGEVCGFSSERLSGLRPERRLVPNCCIQPRGPIHDGAR